MNVSCLVMACSLVLAQPDSTQKPASAEPEGNASILIDWIHANDFSMIGLRPGIYDYHVICGFRHGMEFLASRGAGHDYLSEGRITPERLAPYKLLFINLVSAEREPFLVSEVMAIRDYVKQGGSLLVIMDHSNCYFHSHRLKPLLEVLGIQAFVDTACDSPPRTLGNGNGWLTITEFSPHPITQGLRRLGYQTGGRLDPRYSVAWTGDQAWADEWAISLYGQNSDGGNYGNFKRDDHEPLGPHGVVLAREFHQGRIVVVGDQNMWGDAFINYGDNYRLWINVAAWLLRDPKVADWKAYETWHHPRIVLYEPGDTPRFGSCEDGDYYHLFCLLGRHYWTFANDRLDEPAELRVVADGRREFSGEETSKLSDYVRGGGKLLILPHVPSETQPNGKKEPPLSASLDLSGAERSSTGHATEYVFPAGGRVVLLAEGLNPDCGRIAPAVQIPNADQQEREATILKIVRQVLGQ